MALHDPTPSPQAHPASSQRSAGSDPVAQLRQQGQSVWIDFLQRRLITSGELERLVKDAGLAGLTSNPAIFQKAIEGNDDYAPAIAELAKNPELGSRQLFEMLAVEDVRSAADVLLPVYRDSRGADGYVSLEVAPDVARDTAASVDEGRRLWKEVNRPNLMIKIPATEEGLPAIATLLGEGINVNITLLFARATYERVAETYIEALEARASRGESIDRIASVASFFVSRIDSAVDAALDRKLEGASGAERTRLEALQGRVAIANAKLAYQSYKRLFSGARWQALAAHGALPQRVLWASTGTKNPKYRDVVYVEELIGSNTVNTLPPETLAAFRDHGKVEPTLESHVPAAQHVLDELEAVGISLRKVTDDLLVDGLKKFVEPYQKLLIAVEKQARRQH